MHKLFAFISIISLIFIQHNEAMEQHENIENGYSKLNNNTKITVNVDGKIHKVVAKIVEMKNEFPQQQHVKINEEGYKKEYVEKKNKIQDVKTKPFDGKKTNENEKSKMIKLKKKKKLYGNVEILSEKLQQMENVKEEKKKKKRNEQRHHSKLKAKQTFGIEEEVRKIKSKQNMLAPKGKILKLIKKHKKVATMMAKKSGMQKRKIRERTMKNGNIKVFKMSKECCQICCSPAERGGGSLPLIPYQLIHQQSRVKRGIHCDICMRWSSGDYCEYCNPPPAEGEILTNF
jgi:hypothetical protein